MSAQRIRCTVTRYRVLEDALHQDVRVEHTDFHVSDGWLYLHNSSASAPVENLLADARAGRGWTAQAGTPPVFVEGRWGGRVWPRIHVYAADLLKALG